MKISFISDSETGINIFPEIIEKLKAKIPDMDAKQEFVPFKIDLPQKAKELSKDSDLIFVLALYEEAGEETEEMQKPKFLTEKLIDVETNTGVKIIKAVEESDISEVHSEEELQKEKQELINKWSNFTLDFLKHKEKFVPKEKKEEGEKYTSYTKL